MTVNASWIKRLAGYLLSLVVILFLGRTLLSSWHEVMTSGIQFGIDPLGVAASLVLSLFGALLAVASWRQVVVGLGQQLRLSTALRAWFLSNLMRYVPGNLWQVATMMMIAERAGVSKSVALLSQVIYLLVALSIAGVLGISFLVARPEFLASAAALTGLSALLYLPAAPIIGLLGLCALVGVVSVPSFYRLVLTLTTRVIGREITASVPSVTRGLLPPLLSVLAWVTNGIAFFVFVSALAEVPPRWVLPMVLINAGAYFVGYVSFVAPSGLGFREGALALMLSAYFPTAVAVALALVTRLWAICGELLGAAAVCWLFRSESPSGPADVSSL